MAYVSYGPAHRRTCGNASRKLGCGAPAEKRVRAGRARASRGSCHGSMLYGSRVFPKKLARDTRLVWRCHAKSMLRVMEYSMRPVLCRATWPARTECSETRCPRRRRIDLPRVWKLQTLWAAETPARRLSRPGGTRRSQTERGNRKQRRRTVLMSDPFPRMSRVASSFAIRIFQFTPRGPRIVVSRRITRLMGLSGSWRRKHNREECSLE
jgi:hypothetical protein